jgi:carbonic anhydrase/acetyltransferase-like protein (isoleucine patch superfamily)
VSPGPIYPLAGKVPVVAEGVFVAPTAAVIGDVELAEGSCVWFGAVVRGDIGPIRIGARTNVQDLACLHLTAGVSVCTVGADCTIGHGAILHGCTVEDGCLIGMGSIILDQAVIGARSVIAAGALVPPRTVVPPGSFVAGVPAKVIRPASEVQQAMGVAGAEAYTMAARVFMAEAWASRGGS